MTVNSATSFSVTIAVVKNYSGPQGKSCITTKDQIEFHQQSRKSIMSGGLLQNLMTHGLPGLFAFFPAPE